MISVGGSNGVNSLNVNEWLNMGPDTAHALAINKTKSEAGNVGLYPNPFNEKTTIALTLEKEQTVSVSVFDIHGRFVTELCNKNLSGGNHNIVWNASNATSGVYMVRILIGNTVLNRKLIKN